MLYFIGLGLFDEKDISIRGAEILKTVDVIYAEFYTASLFGGSINSLEELLGVEIDILNREEVEDENILLIEAENKDVAFLSAGDPLIATTHSDMMIQARKMNIKTRVVHSASILSAAPGIAGLQAYKFGKVTTIPFTEANYFPYSPYLNIKSNLENGMHTLVLLDIQAHLKRYMTAIQGLEYLMLVSEKRSEHTITLDTLAVVVARAGAPNPVVRADKIRNLLEEDFGGPLHSIFIPSDLHFVEAEALVVLGGASPEIIRNSL